MTLRLAVFASGGGSNLQALIDRFNASRAGPVRVALVLSDRPEAGALARARAAGIETATVTLANRPLDYVVREIMAGLDGADIDVVALAGFLRLVPPSIVRRFRNRMLNIHPALLPAFGGKGMYGARVHRAVIDAGCTVSGATVHFVDEKYDEGRIIAQWPVPVRPTDTPETLGARVLRVEHMLYPAAIELVARAIERGENQLSPRNLPDASFTYAQQDAPDEAALREALGLD